MLRYADDIQCGDILRIGDGLKLVTGTVVSEEDNLVGLITRDMWDYSYYLPSPFALTDLIEVYRVW